MSVSFPSGFPSSGRIRRSSKKRASSKGLPFLNWAAHRRDSSHRFCGAPSWRPADRPRGVAGRGVLGRLPLRHSAVFRARFLLLRPNRIPITRAVTSIPVDRARLACRPGLAVASAWSYEPAGTARFARPCGPVALSGGGARRTGHVCLLPAPSRTPRMHRRPARQSRLLCSDARSVTEQLPPLPN